MKRVFTWIAVAMLCLTMVLPVLGAEFVPSVTYKDGPDIKKANIDGENMENCLVITSIKEATGKSTDIPQAARDLLLDVYNQLDKGNTKLPLEGKYVVLELVDISFKQTACVEKNHGHKEKLDQPGITLTLDVTLDVKKDVQVEVLTYTNGVWEPITAVVNNGDGTLTCTFEHLCPVAFCVPEAQYDGSDKTGDNSQMTLWIVMMLAALAGIVVLTVAYVHNTKKK